MARHLPFRSAFLTWLAEAGPRLSLPIVAETASGGCTRLHIGGVNPAISVQLSHDREAVASVNDSDGYWDMLLCWAEVAVESVPGGWKNTLLFPEAQAVLPTLDALWRADCFEVLLEWINSELAPATHVGLWGGRDHGTWAWLLRDGRRLGRSPPEEARPAKLVAIHGWPDLPGLPEVD